MSDPEDFIPDIYTCGYAECDYVTDIERDYDDHVKEHPKFIQYDSLENMSSEVDHSKYWVAVVETNLEEPDEVITFMAGPAWNGEPVLYPSLAEEVTLWLSLEDCSKFCASSVSHYVPMNLKTVMGEW